MSLKWPLFPLEDCLDALIDYRGKTPEKTTSGIPLITAKVIKGGRIEKPNEFIAVDNYDAWMRRGIPECGDVVLTVEAPLGEVAQHGHVLTPGRYVGAEEVEDDDEAFADKMQTLTAKLGEQMGKGAELDALIRQKLGGAGV